MKKYLVYGNGLSGQALKELLRKDCEVVIYDDTASKSEITITDALIMLPKLDALILSPGVSRGNRLCVAAKTLGIKIIGEFEFASKRFLGKQIAITGTNGKTTTTEMIHHILSKLKFDCRLLGNGGVPFSSGCDNAKANTVGILEVSNFQLEGYEDYNPYVSAICNIAPDHLDRYESLDEYIETKCNVFKGQSENYTFLNYDDFECRRISRLAKCKVIWFSARNPDADCYYDNNVIYCEFSGINYEIPANIEYYVSHNISNMVLAASICALIGADTSKITHAIDTYKLPPHRVEYVGEICGINFYNDSKATNVHATVSALRNFKRVCLILGGSDKGENFDSIFEFPDKIRFAACVGDTSKKIIEAARRKSFGNISAYQDLFTATRECFDRALLSDAIVLLSPACASFDKYENYEHRGNCFKETVKKIYESIYI